jgi:CHAT domain-containing protein
VGLNSLAFFCAGKSREEKTVHYLEQGLAVEEANIVINLEIGAEAQKRDYISIFQHTTDASISFHLQHNIDNYQSTNLAFTTLLRRKGRVLNTITDSLQRLRKNLPLSEQVILEEFFDINTQLAASYHNQTNHLSPEYITQRTILEQKSSQLADDLSRRSIDFRNAIQAITPTTVQSQIPSNSALIELIRYRPFNPKGKPNEQWGNPHYAAYILTSSGPPQGIDLGPAEPIDKALKTLRTDLGDKSLTPISQLKTSARALDQKLMQPIRQRLGNTRNLLISPDSALHLLPFEALVDEQDRYLLETYNITYLSSGHDLLRFQNPKPNNYLSSGHDLLRFQNPKPNNNPPLILADPYFDKPGKIAVSPATRSIKLVERDWSPLDKTADEAKAIGTLFGIRPFLGSNATETIVKQTTSPSILHIATHGFFQPTTDSTTNPLLNSGLVFAGFRIGKSGNDDGILTALEVSNLNLSGTKLVTLSACDTGLGTVTTGEGIYGLRRALSVAGAESQTISLWKVADETTKDLMINYYTRLKQGEGRSEALHNAQRDMLKSKDYSHPYYWAAFIPSGDWRPMNNK